MKKITDRVILGAVSGILAGLPARSSNAILYKTGLTEISSNQLAAPLFLPKRKVDTPGAIVLSEIINNTNLGAMGILMTYLFSLTGRDRAIIKGIGVGTISWIFVEGLIAGIGLGTKSDKPVTHILSFLNHAMCGSLCGVLISKLGDDRLFPDSDLGKLEKIPVVNTGVNQNTAAGKET